MIVPSDFLPHLRVSLARGSFPVQYVLRFLCSVCSSLSPTRILESRTCEYSHILALSMLSLQDVFMVAAFMVLAIAQDLSVMNGLPTPVATEPAAVVQVIISAPGTTVIIPSFESAGATVAAGNILTAPSTIIITSTHTPTVVGTTSQTKTEPSPSAVASAAVTASATSTPAGLSSVAKIGIGLGVPLGVIIAAAVIGFLMYRYRRHKQNSRLQHHGFIQASRSYSTGDEGARAFGFRRKAGPIKALKHDNNSCGSEPPVSPMTRSKSKEMRYDTYTRRSESAHELHGHDVPDVSRELPGSHSMRPSELPAERGFE